MLTIIGDLWTVDAAWRLIPTNLCLRSNSTAVMGAGVALQAARRYPNLPTELGRAIRNTHIWKHALIFHFPAYRLTCLPTKTDWRQPSNLDLIEDGLRQFVEDLPSLDIDGPVVLPLLGCGLGGLPATTVRPLLERLLDDRFVLVLPRMRDGGRPTRPKLQHIEDRRVRRGDHRR